MKHEYKAGDKVRVIDAEPIGSGGHYEDGDIFEVAEADDGILYTTEPATTNYDGGMVTLYEREVVPYEEEEFDVATELAESLLQAIEDKQEEVLMADHVALGTETPAYDMPSEIEKESRGLGEYDGRPLVEPMPVSRALETMQRVLLKARKDRADKAIADLKETEERLALYADKVKVGELSREASVSSQKIEEVSGGLHDVITSPSHYANSAIEPIEYMADKLPAFDDGFTAFCAGNVLKYVSRAPHKHETPLEDLRKARQYLDFAIEHEEKKRK